jgi:hypothetical protein
MKSFHILGLFQNVRSIVNAVPVALLIFVSACYLVLAANIVSMVNNKLLLPLAGLAFYVVLVSLVRGVTRLWLRNKEDRERTVGHLLRGIDRVAFAYVVWTVVISLFPWLSIMSSNTVMTTTEKLWIESSIVLCTLVTLYIVWYIMFGKSEKMKPGSRRVPINEN